MCVYKNFELVRCIPLIGNPLSLEFVDNNNNILSTICYNNILFYDLRESARNGFISRFQPSSDPCTALSYNNNKLYVSCGNVLYQVDKSFQKTNEMYNNKLFLLIFIYIFFYYFIGLIYRLKRILLEFIH